VGAAVAYTIAFLFMLIQTKNIPFFVSILLLLVIPYAETLLLNSAMEESSFNFAEQETKVVYAKAKLLFSLVGGALYAVLTAAAEGKVEKGKSMIALGVLVILSIIRDKYEK